MYTKLSATFLAVALIAGCANAYDPVVDFRVSNNTSEAYDQNLRECRALAKQGGSAAEDAVVGGLGGAALGAAVGAIGGAILGGGAGTGAAAGAGIGGATGAAGGAISGVSDERSIIRNCLRGRGYAVLD
ncbi:MAG: hypothetical protein GDA41_10395 [Rhodospirillales bacterium]|nr:hypothetical protein [Rhodospirillales bacterium]